MMLETEEIFMENTYDKRYDITDDAIDTFMDKMLVWKIQIKYTILIFAPICIITFIQAKLGLDFYISMLVSLAIAIVVIVKMFINLSKLKNSNLCYIYTKYDGKLYYVNPNNQLTGAGLAATELGGNSVLGLALVAAGEHNKFSRVEKIKKLGNALAVSDYLKVLGAVEIISVTGIKKKNNSYKCDVYVKPMRNYNNPQMAGKTYNGKIMIHSGIKDYKSLISLLTSKMVQ